MNWRTKQFIILICSSVFLVIGASIPLYVFHHSSKPAPQKEITSNAQVAKVAVTAVSTTESAATTKPSCQNLFISWNLANFGKSKSPEALEIMAEVLRNAKFVAVQEVNAGGNLGANTLAKLADILSRKGSAWDYVVSDPTRPANSEVERYGYLMRKEVFFSRKSAYLVSELEEAISREPFTVSATLKDFEPIQFFSIHTVPTKKGPEREVKALLQSEQVTKALRAIFSGDFNLPAGITDTTFEAMGYKGTIREKTSLKQKLDTRGGYLFHQYDNIYVKGVSVSESGVIDFVVKYFSPVTDESLKKAREVSDHLPVYACLQNK